MARIYSDYAAFYDGSGQIRFAVLMSHYVQELLQHHPVGGRTALDLACGTGTLALLLADAGWNVVGIDAAPEMLTLAQGKADALIAEGSATFLAGDLRSSATAMAARPDLPQQFDLITCSYDSLNYLLHEDDLAACFANVAQLLAPGGMFVADMNTRHFLEHDWDPTSVIESTGFIQVQQSYFDPATSCSTMVLTGFVGDDDDGYQRFDETHIERAYPSEQVELLFDQAGLVVEAAYDCFTLLPPYPTSQRIAWVARLRNQRR